MLYFYSKVKLSDCGGLMPTVYFRQVNSELEVISTIFSVRAVSVVVASLASGWLFSRQWTQSGQRRLILMSAFHLVIALSWVLIPFAQSFIQLAICEY